MAPAGVVASSGGGFGVTGAISVTALSGNDILGVGGIGRINGVAVNFGTSTITSVLLSGGLGELTVAGAVSYNADAAATRSLNFSRVNALGALTVTGGSGVDGVVFSGSLLRGAVKLDLLGGGDLVQINDTTFAAAFTLLGGAGTDTINIESSSSALLSSQFHGAVLLSMGDDADTVLIATPNNVNRVAIFNSSLTIDGGNGMDTYTPGTGASFPGGVPVVSNIP